MRWDGLAAPVDGVADALDVVAGFDDVLVSGLVRPSAAQASALTALADAVAVTPLADRVAEAVDKVLAGSVDDGHLAALAAARSALLGAAHDALLARFDEVSRRTRPAWPASDTAADPHGDNLRAACRSWLCDLAIAGWRGVDHDLVSGSAQAVQALLAEPRLRRLAVLLDGFTGELRASCPGAAMARVPVRRWADLWARAVLLCQPGTSDTLATGTASGRLLPLGLDLHEHPTAVQAQVYAVLEPSDGQPNRLVRASVSSTKVDTIVGRGVWQLLRARCTLLTALAAHRSVEISEMPVTGAGDLVWRDECARADRPADPFATARVQLAGAVGAPVPPLDRHPVRIAEPVLVEGYTVGRDDARVTFTVAGAAVEVDVARLSPAGPLTPALVGGSSACLGLMRWDAGRWTLQPLAVEAKVKGRTVAVNGGDWAGGATDAAGKKTEAAANDAAAVLRERAGRLLRT